MRIPIHNVGAIGIVNDIPTHELPPEAWSDGRNIRTSRGSVWKSFGDLALWGVPLFPAYGVFPIVGGGTTQLYVYPSLTAVGATDGSAHADITRSAGGVPYTGTTADRWNGAQLAGVLLLNNGIDVPQSWVGPSLGVDLTNLANFPASTTAKVIRTFRQFIFAGDLTESGTRRTQRVKWSAEAVAGAVPTTWDPAVTNQQAGQFDLSQSDGAVIDFLSLGKVLIGYKEDQTYIIQYVGGRFVFSFDLQFRESGILAQDCAKEWNSRHVVMTPEDIVTHDGSQMDSILEGRMKDWYANRIDPTHFLKSFLAFNPVTTEFLACFPENGSVTPNIAIVIDPKTGKTTVRDIPRAVGAAHTFAVQGATPTTFDSQTTPFDLMIGLFGGTSFQAGRKRLVMAVPEVSRNLFQRSNDFTNAYWTADDVTFLADQVANPLTGVVDVEKIRATAVNANHGIIRSITKTTTEITYTLTVYARATEYSRVRLTANDAATADFLLSSAGSLIASASAGGFTILATEIVQQADPLWYRLSTTIRSDSAGSITLAYRLIDNAGLVVFTGDGTSGLYLANAQIREGLEEGTYQETTTVAATSAFFMIEQTFQFDGVNFRAYVERTGLAIVGKDRQGNPKVDVGSIKVLKEIYPKARVANGTQIQVYVATQDEVEGSVTWTGPFPFTPGSQDKVDITRNGEFGVSGKLLGVRFETTDGTYFKLDSYDLEFEIIGAFS